MVRRSRYLILNRQLASISLSLLMVASSLTCSGAFLTPTISTTVHNSISTSRRSPLVVSTGTTTLLFNVPPPAEGTAEYKEYASKQSPPASFFELQQDSIKATRVAMKDGHKLLEIEFPPLPQSVLEMDDVSAYDVAEANLNLALEFAKGLLAGRQEGVQSIAIVFPDQAETDFAIEKAGSSTPFPGISIQSLLASDDDRIFKPEQVLLNLFGKRSGEVQSLPNVDVVICLTFSAQELPDIEELHQLDSNKTIVFYNLKLDVLRGDLGAPAFPGKGTCRVRPQTLLTSVFYLHQLRSL